jgi:hypothetical protein
MSLSDLEAMQNQGILMGTPMGAGFNNVGMAEEQRDNQRDGMPRRRRPSGPFQPFVNQAPMMDPNVAFQLAAQQHFGAQNRMLANTNSAISKEMDRRVSIARDIREMAHARDMERMRQEYALQRLQRGEPPRRRGGTYINGRKIT